MRIRRKPWARPELAVCDFFIDFPNAYKGKWHSIFAKQQPIYLELGCGKGLFISTLASRNLDKNFIAVDVKSEMLALAKRNIEKQYNQLNQPVANVLLTAKNIEQIDNMLGREDLVSRVYINFCNPWPKARHKKRRLTHPKQLEKYKTFLAQGADIFFKTDDENLFDESVEYFNTTGFDVVYITRDLLNSDFTENISTEHERMFSEQGVKIKFLIARLK